MTANQRPQASSEKASIPMPDASVFGDHGGKMEIDCTVRVHQYTGFHRPVLRPRGRTGTCLVSKPLKLRHYPTMTRCQRAPIKPTPKDQSPPLINHLLQVSIRDHPRRIGVEFGVLRRPCLLQLPGRRAPPPGPPTSVSDTGNTGSRASNWEK